MCCRYVASVRSKQPLSVPLAGSVYCDAKYSVLPDTTGYSGQHSRSENIVRISQLNISLFSTTISSGIIVSVGKVEPMNLCKLQRLKFGKYLRFYIKDFLPLKFHVILLLTFSTVIIMKPLHSCDDVIIIFLGNWMRLT